MKPLHTVEAFVVEAIKTEQLPSEITGCPLSIDARRALMAECPVILVTPGQTEDGLPFTEPREITGYDPAAVALLQPSEGHQRSFALQGEGLDAIWEDEYGNTFGSFNLKGNNFSKPGVMEHPTATDDYIAWGLQESKIIERVLKASRVMRSRGIGTEYIVGLAEPKAYPYPLVDALTEAHAQIGLADYRDKIVESYWRTLPAEEQAFEKLGEIKAKFLEMTFYISLRAADTSYRLGDVCRNPDARAEVFQFINEHWLDPDEKPLDSSSILDTCRYLREFLAPSLGRNLARLHPDLAHGFMHRLNVTGLGSLVDTDSIHGEPLDIGDEPVTAAEQAKDLFTAAAEVYSLEPTIFKESEKMKPVWQLFARYIKETESLLGAPAARTQIAEMLVAYSADYNDNSPYGQNDVVSTKLFEACSLIYFDLLFVQTKDTLADVAHFDVQVNDELLMFASHPDTVDVVREAVQLGMAGYMETLLGEFIDRLEDPSFDIISALLSGKYNRLDAVHNMKHDIACDIVDRFKPRWADLSFPEAMSDDVVKELLFSIYMLRYHENIESYAETALEEVLPGLEPEMRKNAHFEKPESVLPDYQSYPINSVGMYLWLATEQVPINQAYETLLTNNFQLEIRAMHTRWSNEGVIVENAAAIEEMISDGFVSLSSCGLQNDVLKVSLDSETASEPTYAAFITKPDARGKRTCIMYVAESELSWAEHVLKHRPLARPLQGVLF